MSNNKIEYIVNINGIETIAYYSDKALKEVFIPLLRNLSFLQKEKGKRLLVMLAAAPGTGKSTLASFLEKLSNEEDDIIPLKALGIDGFHHYQDYLLRHTTIRNNEEIPLVRIKGAPITFDLNKLEDGIKEIINNETCTWPTYDRLLHNPVEDAIIVNSDIVLIEGNYLLLDEDGWRDLHNYADYTIQIKADEALLRERLINRRIKTGVSKEDSISFVDYSDMENVKLCLNNSLESDLTIMIDDEEDYYVL